MTANQTSKDVKSKNDRRTFLKTTAAATALLAGAALPQAAQASIHHVGGDIIYTGGVITSPDAPGLILNVYLSVDKDGTGVGTLSDALNPGVNSHLEVQKRSADGDAFRFEGVVSASNQESLVQKSFVVAGVVTEEFTSLALRMDGVTFLGKGFLVSAPKFINPIGGL